jgi:diguanylate cyclase (GGDEF)-like protein
MNKDKTNKKGTKIFTVEQNHELSGCALSCSIIEDYAERIAYLENLVKKYKFDHLTGLMLKADFTEKFDRVFEEYRFADLNFTLAIIDVVGLHNVNMTKGVHAGDELILGVVERLKEKFGFHQIFRIGGDEFAVIVRDSVMSNKEVNEKLAKIDNSKFVARVSSQYTSPKHMIKSVDKELSKLKLKSRERRL